MFKLTILYKLPLKPFRSVELKETTPLISEILSSKLQRNKMAPFSTLGKPTCGFGFSRLTNNRKQKIGIMPSNLVKWRSQHCKNAQVRRSSSK